MDIVVLGIDGTSTGTGSRAQAVGDIMSTWSGNDIDIAIGDQYIHDLGVLWVRYWCRPNIPCTQPKKKLRADRHGMESGSRAGYWW
jgi:hypothetical protein